MLSKLKLGLMLIGVMSLTACVGGGEPTEKEMSAALEPNFPNSKTVSINNYGCVEREGKIGYTCTFDWSFDQNGEAIHWKAAEKIFIKKDDGNWIMKHY